MGLPRLRRRSFEKEADGEKEDGKGMKGADKAEEDKWKLGNTESKRHKFYHDRK